MKVLPRLKSEPTVANEKAGAGILLRPRIFPPEDTCYRVPPYEEEPCELGTELVGALPCWTAGLGEPA